MYFKRLEIHGFKSFADPVTIEFDRGITCIVGPNGSGKSNICDAIRWVLGLKSAKALRGDKMEDVIFAGTASRRPRGMAEVTLVIDNSDGALKIDYNEVAVTRRMYRSGESEYLINNNQCRQRDIRELMMDTGIGVEGYSIIGQGKISDIISNNTDSIREILEETAGIVMYRSRKAESERKLESATANVERVNDIIGEIESRIDGLRESSEKAAEYLQLRDRYRRLGINITLRNIDDFNNRHQLADDDLQTLQQQIAAGEKERQEADRRIGELTDKRAELDRGIDAKRAEQVQLLDEIHALTSRGELDDARLQALTDDDTRLQQEIAEFEEKIRREQENSRSLSARRREWENELKKKQRDLDRRLQGQESEQQALEEARRTLDDHRNRLIELQRDISSRGVEIDSIDNLKETLDKRRAAIASEQSSGAEDSRAAEDLQRQTEEKKAHLQEELTASREARQELLQSAAESRQRENDSRTRMQEQQVELGKLTARRRALEEMEHSYEGYNQAVKFIMKQDLAGIDGVIADLIEVPDGLETAVETALGAAMQNIVCEDDEVAREAVRLLKENRAGRLTFLPAQTIRPRTVQRETGVATAPGFRGYGVDCIKFDEKYRKVMEYLLGGVLIVDSLENALALSRRAGRRYRLVTVDGEVINSSGAITGGRSRRKNAGILGRKAEIQRLAERCRGQEEAQREAAAALNAARAERERLEQQAAEREEEIHGLEHDLFAAENELTALQKTLAGYEEDRRRWSRELGSIAAEEADSRKVTERLRQETEKLQQEAAQLSSDLEQETAAFEERRQQLAAGDQDIVAARLAVSSCESEKAKVDAVADKTEEALRGFEEERDRRRQQLEDQARERQELESARRSNETALRDQKAAQEKKEQELQALRQEKDEVIVRGEEMSLEREELEHTARELADQKAALEIRLTRLDTQLEHARDKLWEEFEMSYAQALDLRDEEFVMSAAVKENRGIKKRLQELGDVNVGAIEEYREVSERYEFLTSQRSDIETSMTELRGMIRDMDRIIRRKFKESFDQVVTNFEAVFRELYGGGHARIMLSDENDPFGSEIEITAQPPGKQLKNINLLSGGEKTMTAIALMFAVLKTKPTPCCVLDEVEAALDDSNLDIFGNYVRAFEGVQFTLITHQKTTMEHADVMYGITMPESGVSRVYSLRMDDEETPAAAHR
ncbi:MAG: chromosome segregation protein SMC [Anaerovoracaceae bacterium]|jgi:chromosome segregation protein